MPREEAGCVAWYRIGLELPVWEEALVVFDV